MTSQNPVSRIELDSFTKNEILKKVTTALYAERNQDKPLNPREAEHYYKGVFTLNGGRDPILNTFKVKVDRLTQEIINIVETHPAKVQIEEIK